MNDQFYHTVKKKFICSLKQSTKFIGLILNLNCLDFIRQYHTYFQFFFSSYQSMSWTQHTLKQITVLLLTFLSLTLNLINIIQESVMRDKQIKIVWPKHFSICLQICDMESIGCAQIVSHLVSMQILQRQQAMKFYNMCKSDGEEIVQQCIGGREYLITNGDTVQYPQDKSQIIFAKAAQEQKQCSVSKVFQHVQHKKILAHVMKAVKERKDENVTARYYLGQSLILQQQVKRMSVVRNKLRDLYDVFYDPQLTSPVKKVIIILADKNFYCKRKATTIECENFQNPQQIQDSQNLKKTIQEPKSIFRINKKKILKKQNESPTIESKKMSQKGENKLEKQNFFHIRKSTVKA